MSAEITRKRFTFEDCLRMEETGVLPPWECVELINGDLIVVSPTGPRHGSAVDRTTKVMQRLLQERAIIRTQGTVVLDMHAAPLPDIALLKPRSDDYAESNPVSADILLIVEVSISSLDYDSTTRLPLYAITEIREYWVADLENNRLTAYSNPKGDTYLTVRELRRGDSIAPMAFPDCELPVDLLLP